MVNVLEQLGGVMGSLQTRYFCVTAQGDFHGQQRIILMSNPGQGFDEELMAPFYDRQVDLGE